MDSLILGIDEVGRGPWAGPLVVGAVILGENFTNLNELTDSKKLSAKKRTELNTLILQDTLAHGLGWVSAPELDHYGLSASLKLATRRAVKQILATKAPFQQIIIDGTVNFLLGTPLETRVTTMKKADLNVKAVSAASIIAKVARDNYMIECSDKFPGYGFESHVGYGTAAHKAALETQGICAEHRQSFRPIREIMAKNGQICARESFSKKADTNSTPGQKAELAVATYLERHNHQIIAHNYKTKTCEIDLISLKNAQIYFTEVKYSQNEELEGTPLVRITTQKTAQMRYAAEVFLKNHPDFSHFQPLLAAAAVSGEEYTVEEWLVLS